jgi:hypothetical protein
MPQVTELLIQQISGIAQNYASNVAEPSKKLLDMRDSILASDTLIRKFDQTDNSKYTLAAIDGGSLSQQLAGGDLLVTAATLGEGQNNKAVYTDEAFVPAEAFCQILPHKQANTELLSAMRAMLELRVWHKIPHDIRIIDGAYLGNVSTLLFTLIKSDKFIRDALLGYADMDSDFVLQDAIDALLKPDLASGKVTVAVPKSDSSTIYVNHLFEDTDGGLGFNMTDRSLASVLLRPGEFFDARHLSSNNTIIDRLNHVKGNEDSITKSAAPALLKRLLTNKGESMAALGGEDGILYTTYFKPRLWSDSSPVIKLEFLYSAEHSDKNLYDYTKWIVGIIDADIIDEAIMEPWSQYYADRRAKEVSVGADMIKNHLIATATTAYELTGLTRNYRT